MSLLTPSPVLCPLICHNGGVCVRPDRCLCPPDFAGKFCQLHSSGARPPAPAMPGLTRSVYTMPVANHRDDEHGECGLTPVSTVSPPSIHASILPPSPEPYPPHLLATCKNPSARGAPPVGVASMVSVHVEHPQEASVVVHQVERVSGPWEESNAVAAARAEAAAPYTVLAQSAPREDGYSDASGFGYCFRELRGSQVRDGGRVGGRWQGRGPPPGGAFTQHFPAVCVPAAGAAHPGRVLQRGRPSLGRPRLSTVLGALG